MHPGAIAWTAEKIVMSTVLVTGASSGLGEALAWEFASAGHDLILVARSKEKLADMAVEIQDSHSVEVASSPADLSRRGAASRLASRLHKRGHSVDILVNCAGVLEHGAFADIAAPTHQALIDLNVGGLTATLSEFLPPMIERGEGRVLNVASIAAFQPVPGLATYAATKAYVLSLGEALSEELKGSGVSLTTLCPGVTDTNMVSTAQANSEGLDLPGFIVGDAATVAREGYQACIKGDAICVPGAVNQAVTLTADVLPRWLVRRMYGLIGRSTLD